MPCTLCTQFKMISLLIYVHHKDASISYNFPVFCLSLVGGPYGSNFSDKQQRPRSLMSAFVKKCMLQLECLSHRVNIIKILVVVEIGFGLAGELRDRFEPPHS